LIKNTLFAPLDPLCSANKPGSAAFTGPAIDELDNFVKSSNP